MKIKKLRNCLLDGVVFSGALTALVPSLVVAAETEYVGYGIEEIIVTANRRQESIQDSSLIIDAMSREDIAKAGVTRVEDLQKIMPGIQVGTGGPALQVYIRGVGNPGSTAVTNPAVAVSVDGVYVARSQAAGGNFYDLDRIEVLKGPQGTLYGRNASGGAINLLAATPDFDGIHGYLDLEVANYSAQIGEGAINLPVTDALALRAAFHVADRDGYLSDGTDDDKRWSGRLQSLWAPSDEFSLRLWGSYNKVYGKGNGYTFVGADDSWDSITDGGNTILMAGAAANGLVAPSVALPPWVAGPVVGPAPTPPFPPGTNFISLVDAIEDDAYVDMEFWNVHATLSWDLPFATLTVIPAYQEAEMRYKIHPGLSYETRDILNGDNPETSEATSLEIRLSQEGDRMKWVAGFYYYDEEQAVANLIAHGLAQNLIVRNGIDTESLGVFAQATIDVTDELRFIAGIRYTDETIEKPYFERYSLATALGPVPCFEGIATNFDGVFACQVGVDQQDEVGFDKINWKVGVEYDVAPDSMLFLTVATGFKAGGLSQVAGSPFDPEELLAFELGSRNRFMGDRLQINGELFYWQYDDHQEFLIGPDELGFVGQRIANAGKATAKGANIDVVFAASPIDTIHFGVEYLDAHYDEFEYEQSAQYTPPIQTCDATDTGKPANPGYNLLLIDCGGFQLSRASEWTGSASYTHTFNFNDGSSIDASIDMTFASERWLSVTFMPEERAEAYEVWNANVVYTSPEGKLTVNAFMRNITEEEVYGSSLNHSQVYQLLGQSIGAPRTYGVRVGYNF